MSKFLKISLIALMVGMVGLTGCQKKPKKPSADATAMGPDSGSLAFRTGDSLSAEPGSGLENRDPFAGQGPEVRGIVQPVYFDFDRAEVKASEASKVEEAAKQMKDNPNIRLKLEGSCDWRGTTEYNIGLGDRRCQSVKSKLIAAGVPASRIDVLSKGDNGAIEGASDAEMAKDRRVEFVFLK